LVLEADGRGVVDNDIGRVCMRKEYANTGDQDDLLD
jgi:hypothetical protein